MWMRMCGREARCSAIITGNKRQKRKSLLPTVSALRASSFRRQTCKYAILYGTKIICGFYCYPSSSLIHSAQHCEPVLRLSEY